MPSVGSPRPVGSGGQRAQNDRPAGEVAAAMTLPPTGSDASDTEVVRPPRRRRPRVGLLLNTLSYTYQNDILRGAHDAVSSLGADLYCFSGGPLGGRDQIGRSSIYDLISQAAVDALIVSTSTLGNVAGKSGVLDFCRRFPSLPICSIGAELEGVPSLLVDDFTGVRDLTIHLADVHGHARIAILSGPLCNDESVRRLAGYRAGLAARNLPAQEALFFEGDFTHRAGLNAVFQFFDEGAGCDAIVAANDWMALGALEALDKRGLRVPRDVAVVGFDDIDEARFTVPSLSTVQQPIRELGEQAARLVLVQLAGERVAPTTTLPTSIVLRHSCGCFDGTAHPPEHRRDGTDDGPPVLARHRERLVMKLEESMPRAGEAVTRRAQATRLITSLCSDLIEGTHHHFLESLDEVLGSTANWGNVHAWHDTISGVRAQVEQLVRRDGPEAARLERVVERAHVIISAAAERGQGRRRLEQENLLRTLQQTAATLLTATDIPSLSGALADSLAKVGVPSCSVALQQVGRLAADAPARLAVAYDLDDGLLVSEPRDVRGDELILPPVLPDRRRSMVLQPLFVGTDVLGFFGLEIGPLEGTLYEVLREQLSAAVKGVQLFRAVVDAVKKREQAERARLEDEMRLANRIQTSILPKTSSVSNLRIAATMLPATEVGGDYFDVVPFEGGCWIGIGDVAGHGLPTGLVMLMIQSIVAATTRITPNASAGAAWKSVNNVLYDNIKRLKQDEYATLSLIRYEANGALSLAGAHEELIVYRSETGKCGTLPLVGMWAGIASVSDPVMPETGTQLNPGDILLLYTDGVTESMNAVQEQFGVERLCREMEAVAGATTDVTEIRDYLIASVQSWNKAPSDDITVVVIRREA